VEHGGAPPARWRGPGRLLASGGQASRERAISYCPTCGTDAGDAAFCPACGARQPDADQAAIEAETIEYASWGSRAAALLLDGLVLAGAGLVLGFAIALAFGVNLLGPLSLALPAVYFTYCHGRPQGQTIGKHVLGITVRDIQGRRPIGYPRAFGRYLVLIPISFVIIIGPMIDYLWPVWDRRSQCLHDKAVRSGVFRA
jgi:uncharacterized RDD family membrane protein YckC